VTSAILANAPAIAAGITASVAATQGGKKALASLHRVRQAKLEAAPVKRIEKLSSPPK